MQTLFKTERKYPLNQVVISIDPGESSSGVAIIMLNSEVSEKTQLIGFNEDNATLVSKIKEYYVKYKPVVVIEDMLAYRQKVSNNVIATCKFIGELNYRLKFDLKLRVEYLNRVEVKKWIFEQFNGLSFDRISKKIEYLDEYGERTGKKRYRKKDGTLRKPSFHYVDDRVVIAAMKEFWEIPTPKPGRKNIYGFSGHSWQALAVGTAYLATKTQQLSR